MEFQITKGEIKEALSYAEKRGDMSEKDYFNALDDLRNHNVGAMIEDNYVHIDFKSSHFVITKFIEYADISIVE